MRVAILDVEHGSFAHVRFSDGRDYFVDCGSKAASNTPLEYAAVAGVNSLTGLVIQNYDEDHLSRFSTIIQLFPIHIYYSNLTIPTHRLRLMKEQSGPLSTNMQAALRIHDEAAANQLSPDATGAFGPGGIIRVFVNTYPEFEDPNNLSAVTYFEESGFSILFGGDLHEDGWAQLISTTDIAALFPNVNVFVASHHGRSNGFCPALRESLKPQLIIGSDKSVVHETQRFSYRPYAQGARVRTRNGDLRTRHYVTTRADGNILIDSSAINGDYTVDIGLRLD